MGRQKTADLYARTRETGSVLTSRICLLVSVRRESVCEREESEVREKREREREKGRER